MEKESGEKKTVEQLEQELKDCTRRNLEYAKELHAIIKLSITDLKQLKSCQEKITQLNRRYGYRDS